MQLWKESLTNFIISWIWVRKSTTIKIIGCMENVIAPLLAEPSWWNSTTRQNPLICDWNLYIATTFKTTRQLLQPFRFRMSLKIVKFCQTISASQWKWPTNQQTLPLKPKEGSRRRRTFRLFTECLLWSLALNTENK